MTKLKWQPVKQRQTLGAPQHGEIQHDDMQRNEINTQRNGAVLDTPKRRAAQQTTSQQPLDLPGTSQPTQTRSQQNKERGKPKRSSYHHTTTQATKETIRKLEHETYNMRKLQHANTRNDKDASRWRATPHNAAKHDWTQQVATWPTEASRNAT